MSIYPNPSLTLHLGTPGEREGEKYTWNEIRPELPLDPRADCPRRIRSSNIDLQLCNLAGHRQWEDNGNTLLASPICQSEAEA